MWTYQVDQPIPPGTTFTVVWAATLTSAWNTATDFYRARTVSTIGAGSTGVSETNSSDNTGLSSFARFNPIQPIQPIQP